MSLEAVRVLDLTRLLPGPYATQILADMGADVIKIEDTEQGDYARDMEIAETTRLFESVNGGKRSVAIDLTEASGREVVYDLVADADVVLEQFRPGVVNELGVDFDTLKEHNDTLIYCSISGYGQTGPNHNVVGHDLNYVGYSGLLDLTRPDGQTKPTLPGFPIGDMSGGLFAACNILHRLLVRELATDPGSEYIDIGISDAVLSFSQMVGVSALDRPYEPGETLLTGKYACYNVYRTADDEFITLAALEPKFWRNFCSVVGREALIDNHLSDDQAVREALQNELSAIFQNKPLAEWLDEFEGTDVPVGYTQSVTEAYEDQQTRDRDMLTPVEDTERVVTPGLQNRSLPDDSEKTPKQGEHTHSILKEAGYTNAEIQDLIEAGVI